jgi:Holliday junction DNA helicase RuvA
MWKRAFLFLRVIFALPPYNKCVIYSVEGTLVKKEENAVIVSVGGFGMRLHADRKTVEEIPSAGTRVLLFCHLHLREDALELYGFSSEKKQRFFESLISVNGVGPKSALSILGIDKLENLASAIKEGRADLLTRASGIGRKTADRIILELRNKVEAEKSASVVGKMETDSDLVETLMSLGYRREQAKAALAKVGDGVTGLEERLKAALKLLGRKG